MNPKQKYLKVKEKAVSLLQRLPNDLFYHNHEHTIRVVDAFEILTNKIGLPENQKYLGMSSAWLHDSGFVERYNSNEEIGVRFLIEYFLETGYSSQEIAIGAGIIFATRMPQSPKTLLEEIMCDSDLSHLGSCNAQIYDNTLRKEWKVKGIINVSDEEWIKSNIDFYKKHHFFTDVAKELFDNQKKENLLNMKKKFKEFNLTY